MDKSISAKHTMKINMEILAQEVLDILEADDGKSFEEKREAAVRHLKEAAESPLAETLIDIAEADVEGTKIKKDFWSFGKIECADYGIVLREIEDCDRECYLGLQRKYSLTKSSTRRSKFFV